MIQVYDMFIIRRADVILLNEIGLYVGPGNLTVVCVLIYRWLPIKSYVPVRASGTAIKMKEKSEGFNLISRLQGQYSCIVS